MKHLLLTTAMIAALSTSPVQAGGIFGEGGIIRGTVGSFFDKNVEKPITTPIAKAIENTAADLADMTENVTKGAVALSGLKTIEDVLIEGKSVNQSMDEVLEDVKTAAIDAASAPAIVNHSLHATSQIAGNTLGKDAQNAVGLIQLPVTIAVNLPAALTETVIAGTENISNLDEGAEYVSVPLNAAFKQVLQYYKGQGKPLPQNVAALLGPEMAKTFTTEQLGKVRYVIDDGTSNIASLINAMQTQFGDAQGGNHAVAIDHLIIFGQEPHHGLKDIFFWAHEIQHTVQYERMGLERFAAAYVDNYQMLEEEADQVATEAVHAINVFAQLLGS